MRRRSLAWFGSVLALGCLAEVRSDVRRGDAWHGEPLRVVLLPASCSSVEGACEDEYVKGVSGIVASELEFARYSVSDAEKLVLSSRSRSDLSVELSQFGEQVAGIKSRVQAGAVFEDLSPSQRRALLAEANAQGIVSVKVNIGINKASGRPNEVQIRVGLGDGGDLAWVARCTAPSAMSPTIAEALETATRCALDAVLKNPPAKA